MGVAQWFHGQLQASADGFCWAAEQLPEERRYVKPPHPSEEWTAARHVFHMLHYERIVVVPSMKQWLGASRPDDKAFLDEDVAWEATQTVEAMLPEFRAVRAEQVVLLPQFSTAAWSERRDSV